MHSLGLQCNCGCNWSLSVKELSDKLSLYQPGDMIVTCQLAVCCKANHTVLFDLYSTLSFTPFFNNMCHFRSEVKPMFLIISHVLIQIFCKCYDFKDKLFICNFIAFTVSKYCDAHFFLFQTLLLAVQFSI